MEKRKLYCPQLNNRVEKMQDATQRWVEVFLCKSIEESQAKLNQQIQIQREQYPVVRLNGKTRIKKFAELKVSKRLFSIEDFDENRVYKFLAKNLYTLKVSIGGQISYFGKKINIGIAFKKQFVQLKFDYPNLQWNITTNTQFIKNIPTDYLKPDRIKNMTVLSKNNIFDKT